MAVNLKDIRLKVKFTKKKPDYENTTIGPPRTVDTSDENQQEYEEVDVKATTTNEQLNHPNHNEYLDWDDRQKVKSNADTNKKLDKTETKKHVDDVQLPKAIQENTDKTVLKWKCISIISIILCIGMASALIAITTLSDKVTPCSGVECLNNSTCIYNTTYPKYTCRCPAGFSGASCEVTPCSSFPCLNNGTCSLKDSTYTCSCKAETSGNQCQITPCSSYPCRNNGSCSFNGTAYECTCKSGSTGLNCEVLQCELGGLKCDFEIEDDPNCFLQQDIFDEIDWTRNSGKTPSTNTGPCSAYQGSFYYYLEASPVAVNATARLRSKDLNIDSNQCLTFWYHMYGSHIGTLNVYQMSALKLTLSGDQGVYWRLSILNLDKNLVDSRGNTRVTIEAIRGTSYRGDISIDDVKIISC